MTSDIDKMRLTRLIIRIIAVLAVLFLVSLLFIPRGSKDDDISADNFTQRMIITTKDCTNCDGVDVDTTYRPVPFGGDTSPIHEQTRGICYNCYLRNKSRADAFYDEGLVYYDNASYDDALYFIQEAVKLGHPEAPKLLVKIRQDMATATPATPPMPTQPTAGTTSEEENRFVSTLRGALSHDGWNTDITLSDNNRVITIEYDNMDVDWAERFIASTYLREVEAAGFEKVFFRSSDGTFSAFYDYTQ